MKIFIFLIMIFCHIVDDYYLQGWLAQAKQERYWLKYCGLRDNDIDIYNNHKKSKEKQKLDWSLRPNVRQEQLELYKNDYKMALVEHAFSWTFMVHLPIMIFLIWNGKIGNAFILWFCVSFVVNWIVHAIVDDMKANKLKINLIQDQIIHFTQILATWIIFCISIF